jgi:hypothetical protein
MLVALQFRTNLGSRIASFMTVGHVQQKIVDNVLVETVQPDQ